MVATQFEPHDNWLPPCYHVPKEIEQALIQSGVPSTHWNMAELPNLRDLDPEEICNLVREKSGAGGGAKSSDSGLDFKFVLLPLPIWGRLFLDIRSKTQGEKI